MRATPTGRKGNLTPSQRRKGNQARIKGKKNRSDRKRTRPRKVSELGITGWDENEKLCREMRSIGMVSDQ